MKNITKLSEQSKNPSLLSKRERKKHLTTIKDTLHKGLGAKMFTGIGEKKPLICNVCGERIYSCISEVIKGKIYSYCNKKSCREKIEQIKREK